MSGDFTLRLAQYPRTMTRAEYRAISSWLRAVARKVSQKVDDRQYFEDLAIWGQSAFFVRRDHPPFCVPLTSVKTTIQQIYQLLHEDNEIMIDKVVWRE